MFADQFNSITSLLDQSYPSTGPGLAVLITQNGEPLFMQGFGLARVAENMPVTMQTVFDLASVSKHFTALAVLLLASRGELSPGDDVREYLEEVGYMQSPHTRSVRIHDLIHHTSGLPDYTALLDPSQYPGFTNEQLLQWLPLQQMDFAPGNRGMTAENWDTYCNTNYALLASLVERVTGKGFPEFLQEEFFVPLGMTSTYCDVAGDGHAERACRYGGECELLTSLRDIPVYGDGNIFTTIKDMLRWEAELTRPTLMDPVWLQKAWIPGDLDDGQPTTYGWGFHIEQAQGNRVAYHGGSWDGTSACFTRYLDEGVSIVLMSCSQHIRTCNLSDQIKPILRELES